MDSFEQKIRDEKRLHKSADAVSAQLFSKLIQGAQPHILDKVERQDAVLFTMELENGERHILRLSSNPH